MAQIKIHLVHRETGKEVKQKAKCEAFFFMHIINCYEQDNHVIIDVNGYSDTKFLHALHVKNLRVRPCRLLLLLSSRKCRGCSWKS